jgi:hypothetical protein
LLGKFGQTGSEREGSVLGEILSEQQGSGKQEQGKRNGHTAHHFHWNISFNSSRAMRPE